MCFGVQLLDDEKDLAVLSAAPEEVSSWALTKVRNPGGVILGFSWVS